MADGDVSMIQDEDVLRRMWQQSEDFSRKKEIRAHMYRLREERLRNLYSPEPNEGKGVGGPQTHVKSLLDQSFQGLKSKEVRDAGSPPKDFHYRGQDLKELSNAGWNVESENKTTDDGHTHVRSVHANIEGKYDVEGGAGKFAAVDSQKQAVTEYQDEHSSLKRNESSSNSAAHEQVVQKTNDGTQFSATSSSSTSSKFQQVSTTKHEVPYNDYDLRNTNQTKITKTNEFQIVKSDAIGELVSRKVDHPDENTTVIVETRCLPDGTQVTSTRKEFRNQARTVKSEQHSENRSENRSYSTSSHHKSDYKTSKTFQDHESNSNDIVDSQRRSDDYDFKRNQIDITNQTNEHSQNQRHHENQRFQNKESSSNLSRETIERQKVIESQHRAENVIKDEKTTVDHRSNIQSLSKEDAGTQKTILINKEESNKRHETMIDHEAPNIEKQHRINQDRSKDETDRKVDDILEKKIASDQYQTTYQSDYTQKNKISNDWSPTHQAWASTLRADSPSRSTRAPSPGSNYQSNTSIRSSVSPDKSYKKPPSRGGSPSKTDRISHESTSYSTQTESKSYRYSSPDRRPPVSPTRAGSSPESRHDTRPRYSVSPDKRSHYRSTSPEKKILKDNKAKSPERKTAPSPSPSRSSPRSSVSPDRKPGYMRPTASRPVDDSLVKDSNLESRSSDKRVTTLSSRYSVSPDKRSHYQSTSPEKKIFKDNKAKSPDRTTAPSPSPSRSSLRSSVSPDRKPGYMRPTASRSVDDSLVKDSNLESRSSDKQVTTKSSDSKTYKRTDVSEDHYKFIDEETKMYTRTSKKTSPSLDRKSPEGTPVTYRGQSPIRPSLRKESRSPSPPKGPVTFTEDNTDKYGTYDKKKRSTTDINTTTTESVKSEYNSVKYNDKFLKQEPDSPTTRTKKTRDSVSPVKRVDAYSKNDKTSMSRAKDTTETITTNSNKISREPITPTKVPRGSFSPVKDSKYKLTADLIQSEKTTEAKNKKSSAKDHPRQLVTPSTSPTRKPKTDEVLSSGASSPTTSVSEFIYYGSPQQQTIVTDLDDVQYHTEINTEEITTSFKRPDSLSIERSPSPSKIPCRSPSPTKQVSPTKETLPRKSSLKKPSVSPIETPPSNFQISPTVENNELPKHEVVKKNNPNKPVDSFAKVKPPLVRRETYEDRCRKILGMVDDNSTIKKVTKQSSFSKESTVTLNKGDTKEYFDSCTKEGTKTKEDISDFISHEQRDTVDKSTYKSRSRQTSPAKTVKIDSTYGFSKLEEDTNYTKTRHSPDKDVGYDETTPRGFPTKATEPASPFKKATVRSSPENKSSSRPTKDSSPSRSFSPDERPGYMQSTESSDIRHEETVKEFDIESIKTSRHSIERDTKEYENHTTESSDYTSSLSRRSTTPEYKPQVVRQTPDKETGYERPLSPSKEKSVSPDRKPIVKKVKPSDSPDKTQGYLKGTTATSVKHEETKHTEESREKSLLKETKTKQSSIVDKHYRLPSPQKTTKEVTDFIQTEREKKILDKVQKSLRKLSPNREQRSPSREKSPVKSSISLQDIEITESFKNNKITRREQREEQKTKVPKSEKPLEQKGKPARNVSPTKKPTTPSPPKSPETHNKSRSISPKKPVSPQVHKASGIKPRESIPSLVRKATPTKIEKPVTDVKKATTVNKQSSFTKTSMVKTTGTKITSPSSETKPELKRMPTPKGINKENVSPKKDEPKVTRTASESTMKGNKTSPQRMRSKPEILVSDVSPKQPVKQSMRYNRPETKLAPKPKSATALNTPLDDEDDVIIDVEQAKSSRENSPDRICPTPVSFMEDVGTPRLPDEVSEPDDDFRRRTYHTIHETESVVDDIVEISEDDELFVKKSDNYNISESDECLLSVTDKVSKFTNKIENVTKPKDAKTNLTDTEKTFADYMDEKLKSDECLLSVFEKVNKFAQGPKEPQDTRTSTKNITDEYDTETVYTDDYTKLSVNDKAHFFVESAENAKTSKPKLTQKIERPDLSNVDESLKSDDCLLSVTDKVNKFVKTAEHFLNEAHELEYKDKIIKEQYEKFMKKITQDEEKSRDTRPKSEPNKVNLSEKNQTDQTDSKVPSFAKETASFHSKIRDTPSSNLKPNNSPVKITTQRSSEAVKKAKAVFENIATSQKMDTVTTKLTDIGIKKQISQTDSIQSNGSEDISDIDGKIEKHSTKTSHIQENNRTDRTRSSPIRQTPRTQESSIKKSPARLIDETNKKTSTVTKSVLSRYPVAQKETLNPSTQDTEPMIKSQERVTTYSRRNETNIEKNKSLDRSTHQTTQCDQINNERVTEDNEVSSRRGSGKFGVELRKTSIERSVSTERRRSSADHHQPCIEDIFDLDLLEQMLENVTGYEQRRRIRAQIRVTKKKMETDQYKTRVTTNYKRSPERRYVNKSPERQPKAKQTAPSPDRTKTNVQKTTTTDIVSSQHKTTILNGHAKDPVNPEKLKRSQSPEKRTIQKTKSPVRQPSPEKKTRTLSPSKYAAKPKTNRFNEYASAYMKKVGLNESEKLKCTEVNDKKLDTQDHNKIKKSFEVKSDQVNHQFVETTEKKTSSISKSYTMRTSSKDTIETVKVNSKRSVSPDKKRSPERQVNNNGRLYYRSPSPDFKRTKSEKKETIIKTEYDTVPQVIKNESIIKTTFEDRSRLDKNETKIKTLPDLDKKIPKQTQEEKPSWITNRNLKKITSETRSFSSKKVDSEKPKYRAPSPSKVISKPIDVITSSYGPGPLDADGKPLFGIKALRNGASNYQVKGTVIRQDFHSRNGGESEGTVSVTAYSTEPEDLERLLQVQGDRPSRLHGLAAITTTKKFGRGTGTTLNEAHSKEDRAVLDQFTHHERKVESEDRRVREGDRVKEDRVVREDRKNVRQSSVKSLTEKFIKNASETTKSERTSYPKAGLILRSSSTKDSTSSDSSTHAGLGRTDSEHSLASMEDQTVTTRAETTQFRSQEKSFLDSSSKVTGVQDILTRMKNADIVIQEGDTTEDSEARALLNKFLGATVLMAGMQSYVTEKPAGKIIVKQETVRSSGTRTKADSIFDPDQCWDERLLRKLLEESTDYEQRRRLRARIRTLMAEQEACASAVTEALSASVAGETGEAGDSGAEASEAQAASREETEVTVTSSERRNSSEKTVTSSTITKTSKVVENITRPAPKPVSPFAKFRNLDKQISTNSPNSPQSPGSRAPLFKFTDPAVHASAMTIKERLLQWCRDKTRDYENVKLENFSTSWADGLAFCALVHHFLPDAFDYTQLTAEKRRHNFTLAFKVADEKAGIYPLLDVDDMVAMRKPDWKCVFTYVQSIHRRFKDQS